MTQDGRRVLLVEDDRLCATDMAEILAEHGFSVEHVRNGHEALRLLDERDPLPNVILLDLFTPVLGGREFRRAQVEHSRYRAIPVILTSGVRDLEREAKSLGVEIWLRKPFNLSALLGALEAALPGVPG